MFECCHVSCLFVGVSIDDDVDDLNVDHMMNHAVEPRNLLGLTVVCLQCEYHNHFSCCLSFGVWMCFNDDNKTMHMLLFWNFKLSRISHEHACSNIVWWLLMLARSYQYHCCICLAVWKPLNLLVKSTCWCLLWLIEFGCCLLIAVNEHEKNAFAMLFVSFCWVSVWIDCMKSHDTMLLKSCCSFEIWMYAVVWLQ